MARQRNNLSNSTKNGGSGNAKSNRLDFGGENLTSSQAKKTISRMSKRGSPTPSSTTSSNAIFDKQKHKSNRNKCTTSMSTLLLEQWKTLIGFVCLAVASYFGYLGYLETRVNTPFDNQKMVSRSIYNDTQRYWGTYRPLNYFGLKTRDPHSIVLGLMWYMPSNLGPGGQGMRHWCDMNDKLDKYGWSYHDGVNFGIQEIHDLPFELKTSFIKYNTDKQYGGDWTARISVRNTSKAWDRTISLIWYIALDEKTNGYIKYKSDALDHDSTIYGETLGLGAFQLHFYPIKGKVLHKSYLSTVANSLSKLKETVYSHFRIFTSKTKERYIGLPGEIISHNGNTNLEANFIAIQFTAKVDFTIDVAFQSQVDLPGQKFSLKTLKGREFTNAMQDHMYRFDETFENRFHLKSLGFSQNEIKFAKAVLSNLLGGIGYFYGSSRVQSIYTDKPVPYWKASLYTAVPSRSFFPRGFLWDEGFHGLLIATFNLDIELDIINHWFDLLNVEGWIPREQILGVEALAKVPEEFVIQHNSNANPPTFFLVLDKLLAHHRKELLVKERLNNLERLYPRLQAWFAWYNSSQKGPELGTYQWRGRQAFGDKELNPKTLTSGLDDFPRASHPTNQERHIDIRCWMAFAAAVMAKLSILLEKDDTKYYETASYLRDNELLNRQHLSQITESYADWGLHTDAVVLKRIQKPLQTYQRNQQQQFVQQQYEMIRVVSKQPDYKFVDTTFGYVNIFPFLLELLDHDSIYLGKLLENLRNPQMLWTKYGLRSLAKSAPLYQKYNTEHDPPYWRGAIWLNMNYLAVKALRYYAKFEGPYALLAREIYSELRGNLIDNVFREYERTGYIWEQYDDVTGHGKGCYPFTGWSSLIVLIMAEQY